MFLPLLRRTSLYLSHFYRRALFSRVHLVCTMSSRAGSDGEDISWRGVPITEMYGSDSPWGSPEFPLASPGHNHTVLYHIPSYGMDYGNTPPIPQMGRDVWDADHVRMPCSKHSLYPVEVNGNTSLKRRWAIIEESLQKPIQNSEELAEAILTYNTKFKNQWKFRSLHKLFNEHLEEDEAQYFFSVTLPEIAKLALALPKLAPSPIPLLKQHKNHSISLSQEQIACLLANAFFCTFPRRNTTKKNSEYASYPFINFNKLYECAGSESVLEKLKCICHYFRRVCRKVPAGVVTFSRRSVPPRACPRWAASTEAVAATPLHVDSAGTIEDEGVGLIQVDFANKYLGGGVLGHGCVQEEIRFVICPELMLSMLFTEVLRPNEALLMIGCERYSSYSGYGNSFQWSGDYEDVTVCDSSGRRRCVVLAIDALPLSSRTHEYRRELLQRELNKAWVGFSAYTSAECPRPRWPGLASGNWGCGAFGGSADLKSLLQLIAATEAGRPLAYYTFGDVELRNNIINMYNLLCQHNVTVGQLCKIILRYSQTDVRKAELYPFIHQTLIDQERQGGEPMDHVGPVTEADGNKDVTENSPDLFSSEEFEANLTNGVSGPHKSSSNYSPLLEKLRTTEPKDDEITSGPSKLLDAMRKLDSDTFRLTENPKRTENILKTSTNSNISKHTSRLFEEMEKLDAESGMEFKEMHHNVFNHNTSALENVDDCKNNSIAVEKPNLDDSNVSTSSNSHRKRMVEETVVDMSTDEDPPLLACNVSVETKKKLGKKITDYFNRKA